MNYNICTVAKAIACHEPSPNRIYFRRRCSPRSDPLPRSCHPRRLIFIRIASSVRFGDQHIHPGRLCRCAVCLTLSRLHCMSSSVFDINSDSDRSQIRWRTRCTMHDAHTHTSPSEANATPKNGANMSRETISATRTAIIMNVAHAAAASRAHAFMAITILPAKRDTFCLVDVSEQRFTAKMFLAALRIGYRTRTAVLSALAAIATAMALKAKVNTLYATYAFAEFVKNCFVNRIECTLCTARVVPFIVTCRHYHINLALQFRPFRILICSFFPFSTLFLSRSLFALIAKETSINSILFSFSYGNKAEIEC